MAKKKNDQEAIVTVDIYKRIYDATKVKADRKRYKMKEYVNQILWLDLQREKFLSEYAPFLSRVGEPEGNRITLNDANLRRTVDVFLYDAQLYCEIHHPTDEEQKEPNPCVHTNFVAALPEVGQLYVNRRPFPRHAQEG